VLEGDLEDVEALKEIKVSGVGGATLIVTSKGREGGVTLIVTLISGAFCGL